MLQKNPSPQQVPVIPPLAPQPSSPQPSQLQVSLGPPAPLPPWEWSQWSPHTPRGEVCINRRELKTKPKPPEKMKHEIRGFG